MQLLDTDALHVRTNLRRARSSWRDTCAARAAFFLLWPLALRSCTTAMLAADKAALEQTLRVEMLQLQWKELTYLRTNFQNLATTSAVLLGFAFTGITT